MDGTRDGGPNDKIAYLKSAVASILDVTEWPSESKDAATELLNTVKASPDSPDTATGTSQELRGLIEEYIRVLEDIHGRLRDASSKIGMQKWRFLQQIKSMTSTRSSKCTLILKTCQDDVSKATNSLQEHLDQERSNEAALEAAQPSPDTHIQEVMPSAERLLAPTSNPKPKPAEPANILDRSPSRTSLNRTSGSAVPADQDSASPIRGEALAVARKVFNGVEIASGSIPVVGSYVGAVAKVGLAFVNTIQTINKNDDLSNDLGAQTAKLASLLEGFVKNPNREGDEIAGHVNTIHRELGNVHDKVNQWKSLGRFNKAFRSEDHAEALQSYQGTIQTALEEIQLLVSLDTRSMVLELKDSELQAKQRRLLRCLGDAKYGAQGNAIEDVICFPGTRVEILEQIDDWIRDSSTPDRVLWIRGMAGRGKSTIASTVVHRWKCRASCAIFHCRRGQNTLNTRIVCALARQLGTSLVPTVRNAILESVQDNEDIADQRLQEQFETLFVASLAKLTGQTQPILIVIDALDECNNLRDAVDFVRLIDRHSSAFPDNAKFLLTCRPEAPLLRTLEPRQWHSIDLDIVTGITDDLERFIRQACNEIRDSDSDIPKDWPSSENLGQLVEMSQGLFQWARTAITYLNEGSPVDRLRGLLKRHSIWSGLDDLYHQILSKAFDSVKLDPARQDILCRVLGTLVAAPHHISLDIVATLYSKHEIFDGIGQEDIIPFLRKDLLADLNSLLFLPTTPSEPICLMHTSIRDFLVNKDRCEQRPYYIDSIRYHQQLANLSFETMLGTLKENICNLFDLSKPSSEVQDIMEREVSCAVRYCCRAWSTHLTEGVKWQNPGMNAANIRRTDFTLFSKERLMGWLEVMSLLGKTAEAIVMAKQIHQWLVQWSSEVPDISLLVALWNDAQQFITVFFEPISFGPLHIYTSALPHCPVETEIWKLYGKCARVRTVRGIQRSTWSPNLWTALTRDVVSAVACSPNNTIIASGLYDGTIQRWDIQTGVAIGEPLSGHRSAVSSVCFSADGKILASGSDDLTIRLWDPQSGVAVGEPLKGHYDWIKSVCFSPDGKLLASGSFDQTVRIWDTQTGAAVGRPLRGHSGSVYSVCFSPDGTVLASGSFDQTIRLWEIQSGTPVGKPLRGHSDWVRSVCFSPDGKLLASGSHDQTIRLWDTQTRTAIGEPLKGHCHWVRSVCFSPHGKVVASGSDDGTIRLWETQTGEAVGEPLMGHNDSIASVCFSPDGKLLVSGSSDRTVRLWNSQTTVAMGKSLTGDRGWVYSVCLSPDGRTLASAYADHRIQLWDARTGVGIGEPLSGHVGSVSSVCFSPDGRVLASGSFDDTIQLWDPQTRAKIGEPITGHSGWVQCVCFSPDGNVLASGSDDLTIRLWNPQSGTTVVGPLRGHTNTIYSVSFSPDGKVLVSGSLDRTIRLWDTQTGAAVGELLRGYDDRVKSVGFSPDGRVLLSLFDDRTIQFWDAQRGVAVATLLSNHTYLVSPTSLAPC